MDFPFTHSTPASFPWRTAALVAAAVAALELIVLVAVAGSALLTGSGSPAEHATTSTAAATAKTKSSPAKARSTAGAAMLPRRKVALVILNGNGRTGAASSAATRAQRRGYRIKLVGNAPRQDYPSSLVMYRPGFMAEARRLGRDMGIRLVTPLDGRPSQLHGAQTIVILGG